MTTFILFSLFLHAALTATDSHLPPVSAPRGIEEGIEIKLTEQQAAELRPWAENSKTGLLELTQSVGNLENAKSIARLTSGIQEVIDSSHPKHPELLMRYVLGRGLLMDRKLAEETDPAVPGVLRIRKMFLLSSIELALKYYKSDISLLLNEGGAPPPSRIDFVGFGFDHARFLQKFSRRIFDSSAHYQMARLNLGLLHWDLYRDLENKKYAPVINKVHRHLKSWPEATPSEAEAREMTRQMRKLLEEVLAFQVAPERVEAQERQKKAANYPATNVGLVENLALCDKHDDITRYGTNPRKICRNHVKRHPYEDAGALSKNLSLCDDRLYGTAIAICRGHAARHPHKNASGFVENLFHCSYKLAWQSSIEICWEHVKTYPDEDPGGLIESLSVCNMRMDTSREACHKRVKEYSGKNWSLFAKNLSGCTHLAYQESRKICWDHMKEHPEKDAGGLIENLSRCDELTEKSSREICWDHTRNQMISTPNPKRRTK